MLLLIPLDKRLDWKKPPLITIALILINCAIFFFYQISDAQIEQQARQFYVQSGLAKAELPIYKNYLRENNKYKQLQEFEEITSRFPSSSSQLGYYASSYIDIDYTYQQALKDHLLPDISVSEQRRLNNQRQLYLDKYRHSITHNYSLRPASPTLSGLYGHMFLHAGIGHLLGNMIFLALIGFVVEAILGKWLFLVAYLLSGLGSAGLDILIQSQSYNFHLGASGAISGVMGMYAALFGVRKIQFFYNILFWVDRIKAPAFIMLIGWLANEILQLIFIDSNVNYLAHIGGLLTGACIGYLLTRNQKNINTEYMDETIKVEKFQEYMTHAMQFLGELNNLQAKSYLLKALQVKPDSTEVLLHLIDLATTENNPNEFKKYSQRLIENYIHSGQTNKLLNAYQKYIDQTRSQPNLCREDYFQLIHSLISLQRFEQAEKLTVSLFKKDHNHKQFATIFLKLAKNRMAQGDQEMGKKYINLILKYFPNSQSARSIQQIKAQT